jgi:hypothetical protein
MGAVEGAEAREGARALIAQLLDGIRALEKLPLEGVPPALIVRD